MESELYLDLLELCLTDSLWDDSWEPVRFAPRERRPSGVRGFILGALDRLLRTKGLAIARRVPRDPEARAVGRDWPPRAHTMVGVRRLQSLRACVDDVLKQGIPGDFIEAGVWRGGAALLMRAILKARGVHDRTVWLADSFEGLPRPNPSRYPADRGDWLSEEAFLSVPLFDVQRTFELYGLLDHQVQFLKGWFRDTLPNAPFERLALIRLDGDMYESTMDALTSLYPLLQVGGYVVVDDYALPTCRQAVLDFRAKHGIAAEIREIDWSGILWQRE